MNERASQDEGAGTTALMMLVFIGLLIGKAAGWDIQWGVVTAPLWGRFVFIVVVEALSLRFAGSGRS